MLLDFSAVCFLFQSSALSFILTFSSQTFPIVGSTQPLAHHFQFAQYDDRSKIFLVNANKFLAIISYEGFGFKFCIAAIHHDLINFICYLVLSPPETIKHMKQSITTIRKQSFLRIPMSSSIAFSRTPLVIINSYCLRLFLRRARENSHLCAHLPFIPRSPMPKKNYTTHNTRIILLYVSGRYIHYYHLLSYIFRFLINRGSHVRHPQSSLFPLNLHLYPYAPIALYHLVL